MGIEAFTPRDVSVDWLLTIHGSIAFRHPSDRWICIFELRTGTGYGKDNEQRLDAWAMNMWPSSGLEKITYEFKISKSDFKSEIAKPNKRRKGMSLSNRFYFVTPPYLVDPDEIPAHCGLIWVDHLGQHEVVLTAPWRDTVGPTWAFLGSVYRRSVGQGKALSGVPGSSLLDQEDGSGG